MINSSNNAHAPILSMLESHVNHGWDAYQYLKPMETMGDRIRVLRQSRNLSQDSLGGIIGVSGAAIAQWENGSVTGIKPENFLRLCAYFGADPYSVAFGPDGDPRMLPGSAARRRKVGE